jgi:hypothetical protein
VGDFHRQTETLKVNYFLGDPRKKYFLAADGLGYRPAAFPCPRLATLSHVRCYEIALDKATILSVGIDRKSKEQRRSQLSIKKPGKETVCVSFPGLKSFID